MYVRCEDCDKKLDDIDDLLCHDCFDDSQQFEHYVEFQQKQIEKLEDRNFTIDIPVSTQKREFLNHLEELFGREES